MPRGRLRRLGRGGGHFAVLAVFTIFTAFPFYWMLITTFKRTSDLLTRANNFFSGRRKPGSTSPPSSMSLRPSREH